jgi:hypothetical protein
MSRGLGPFDSEITFHTTRNLGRGNLDYKLPESHDGPHVHLYHSGCRWNGYVGYYFFDEPYWPGARPAHVPLTQLAPLVTRHVIYAVTPAIPVVMVVLAWTFWGCLFAYASLRIRAEPAAFG